MSTLVGLAPFFNFLKKAAWYCGKCTRLNSNFPHLLTVCLWTNYSTSLSFGIFIMKTLGKINWVLFQLKWSKKCWYVFYTTWDTFPPGLSSSVLSHLVYFIRDDLTFLVNFEIDLWLWREWRQFTIYFLPVSSARSSWEYTSKLFKFQEVILNGGKIGKPGL